MDASSTSRRAYKQLKSRSKHIAKIYLTNLENLPDRLKVAVLTQTFPGIRHSDTKQALKKCKGKVAHAIDVLLDQVFQKTNESQQRVKVLAKSKSPSRQRKTRRRPPAAFYRRSHNTMGTFRRNHRAKSGLNGRFRTPLHRTLATQRYIRKPPGRDCVDKGKGSARELLTGLNVPAPGKLKDDDKATSVR